MIKILSIVGTRPEAIKMAPVIRAIAANDALNGLLCSTGQHDELLKPVLELFELKPDYELDVMLPGQNLSALTARLLERLDPIIRQVEPDWILAQGDTTTLMVASLIAYYHGIAFGHVEAGLRTGNLRAPFPEELNRRIADVTSELLFAPTENSRQRLLSEGFAADSIIVTGNTVIDAVRWVSQLPYDWSAGPLGSLQKEATLVCITAHRRESFGETFEQMCRAIEDIATAHPEVHCVFPVHFNPNVRQPVERVLRNVANVSLLEPLGYRDMIALMKASTLILTDSGGIQEEAPALNVPVLVMREVTERPEGIDAGVAQLVGTDRQRIVAEVTKRLKKKTTRQSRAVGSNPYGDGKAAERIVSAIMNHARQ